MIKQNKGITLIALMITIIVLLILAGVTINIVLGENGLINKAKTSVGKFNEEFAIEKLNTKIVSLLLDRTNNEKNDLTLEELAEKFSNDEEIDFVKNGESSDEEDKYNTIFVKLKEFEYIFEIDREFKIKNNRINSIKILQPTTEIYAGDIIYLSTDVKGFIKWSSSDESKAKVDENGKVTIDPTATGTVIITAVLNDKYSDECVISIRQKVTSINVQNLQIKAGRTGKIVVTTEPAGIIEDLIFTSDNNNIVVDNTGNVSVSVAAIVGEKAKITVTGSKSTLVKGECTITVKQFEYNKLPIYLSNTNSNDYISVTGDSCASSYGYGYYYGALFDGSIAYKSESNAWCSGKNGFPHYIQLDFAQSHTIEGFKLYPYSYIGTRFPKNVRIVYSTDNGNTWIDAYNGQTEGYTNEYYNINLNTNIEAKLWRLYFSSNWGGTENWTSVSEMEVFGI